MHLPHEVEDVMMNQNFVAPFLALIAAWTILLAGPIILFRRIAANPKLVKGDRVLTGWEWTCRYCGHTNRGTDSTHFCESCGLVKNRNAEGWGGL